MPPKPIQKPLERFAASAIKCTAEETAYGKCIAANYTDVKRGMCSAEFEKLGRCFWAEYRRAR